ncbi:peroxiredoxin family protein [Marinicrinis lubricantis]|uniref:Peroxiredoxin family protein n=1 Tax=Marinicrinis lubricantis TaxID=2086470 RepID=A0ABW1INI2_9BACL
MEMKKNVIAIIVILALVGWGIYDSRDSQSNLEASNSTQKETAEVKVGTQVGNMAPDFQLVSLDGEEVKLTDYRGKKVLLNFWATWCPPCRVEMPHMEKFYNDFKTEEVVILGVNLTHTEESVANVPIFVADFGLTFPIVFDEKGQVSKLYQVVAYPTTYLIDSDGIIREKFQGAINYEIMDQSVSKMEQRGA